MRINMISAVAAMLLLGACDTSESYEVGASEAYAKVLSSSGAEMPTGLLAMGVTSTFSSIPTDRTGFWSFKRNGEELGRINVSVTGDDESSTVSYAYAEGAGAAANVKLARLVKQHLPVLVAESVDSKIENRPVDTSLKSTADTLTAASVTGLMLDEGSANIDTSKGGLLSQASQ